MTGTPSTQDFSSAVSAGPSGTFVAGALESSPSRLCGPSGRAGWRAEVEDRVETHRQLIEDQPDAVLGLHGQLGLDRDTLPLVGDDDPVR